jgi:hypothetical protein
LERFEEDTREGITAGEEEVNFGLVVKGDERGGVSEGYIKIRDGGVRRFG